MDYFNYQQGQLFAENVSVSDIVAEYGSPCYIYSHATITRHWHAFDDALQGFDHLVCYAVKANSNLAVLNIMARMGSGFDIVSEGELERVIAAGGDPAKVVFSGVGKRPDEMRRALEEGIHCFNVESIPELDVLNDVAKSMDMKAPVSLRVNPDVDAQTHPYISTGLKENKFGIDIDAALETYQHAASLSHLNVIGIDCHIGSQLTDTAPFVAALERVLVLIDKLADAGITIEHLDLGGGLGIQYRDEQPPSPEDYVAAITPLLKGRKLKLIIEPGRAIVGNAGILVTRVEYLKPTPEKNFAIVDAAMNDLLRPSLYSAWQNIIPVKQSDATTQTWDIVGPVCETGDFLGKERQLALQVGDLLAIRSSGAYGFVMSSNYNSRPRVAEIMVQDDQVHLVRQREDISDLFLHEQILPE